MKMKKYLSWCPTAVFSLLMLLTLVCNSCNKYETYAEQKEEERNAINAFIVKRGIKVISEKEFKANDSTTDVSKNEYVLIESSGVYMQIVRKGCGSKIKPGETATVLCRFTERNIVTDSTSLTNILNYYSMLPDKMSVTNTSGTFTASFLSTSESLMASQYKTTSVPAGWLTPFAYIRIGRPVQEDEQVAQVNLIVPHSQGHTTASSYVRPYFYTLYFERGI